MPGTSALSHVAFISAQTEGTFRVSDIPWGFLLAIASLSVIFLVFQRRGDVFQAFGFSRQEVAVLCIGSIAGWIVNVPTFIPIGESSLTINLGGALIPLFLVAWWIRKRKLPLIKAAVGVALVAYLTHMPFVTQVVAGKGVISQFPWFFLPSLVALAFAIVTCFRNPIEGVPVAYASGSIGALVGADVMHFRTIQVVFADSPPTDVLSFGGAGVFDMVFLAGSMAMALNLVILAGIVPQSMLRTRGVGGDAAYPGKPLEIVDSRKLWIQYRALADPNAVERATAALALSNLALLDGDFNRSVRMSYLAVDALVKANVPTAARGRPVVRDNPRLQRDLDFLAKTYREAAAGKAGRVTAGDANVTAKLVVGALSRDLDQPSRLGALVQ